MSSPNTPLSARIICPHCRCPIDPRTLESAVSATNAANAEVQYRICPECDEAIVLSVTGGTADDAADAQTVVNDASRAIEERLTA